MYDFSGSYGIKERGKRKMPDIAAFFFCPGQPSAYSMKKTLTISLSVILGILPFASFAVEDTIMNAGFVPANIWYSQEPFFAGDKIRIYTVIFNGSTEDIVGTVEFLNDGITVGTTDFSLSGGGRVRDVWTDWVAEAGKHTITARIIKVSAVGKDGKKRSIILANTETGKSERAIDLDTDGDDTGDTDDLDDDGDGVTDIDEIQYGTDPLKKDTDRDGTGDAEEIKQKEAILKEQASTTGELGIVEGALQKIDEKIPEPISATVSSGANMIERFRIGEGYRFRRAKEEREREILVLRERAQLLEGIAPVSVQEKGVVDNIEDATKRPLTYISFAILALLQYFFEWKILFYGVSFYVLYRLLKWGIGKIRNR